MRLAQTPGVPRIRRSNGRARYAGSKSEHGEHGCFVRPPKETGSGAGIAVN